MTMTETTRSDLLMRAVATCVHPDDASITHLDDMFTEDVTVWSPNLMTSGLAGLAEHLTFREDAFTDVDVIIDAVDAVGIKGFVEFHVEATFSGPFDIGAGEVVEPNGRRLVLGAAAVAEFEAGKIKALRGHFDDATLLEQMFAA